MSSILTRRLALLGMTATPVGVGLNSLLSPKTAAACHLYKSSVDGRTGCGAYRRDTESPTTTDPTTSKPAPISEPQSPTDTTPGTFYYRDELCGFSASRKWGAGLGRLAIGNAPDGKRAVRATYENGKPSCGAHAAIGVFSGGGVQRASFEVDVFLSAGFQAPPGKFLGVYGGGNAAGGVVDIFARPTHRAHPCTSGEGGWSMRVSHGPENRIYSYSYAQNRNVSCSGDKKFGQTFSQRSKVRSGRWVTFRQDVTMNSMNQANGSYELWMDGVRLFKIDSIMYQRDPSKYGIKGWWISNQLGGSCNNSRFFATANMTTCYRDLRVSV